MQIACSTSLFNSLGHQSHEVEQACRCIQHAGLSRLVLDFSNTPLGSLDDKLQLSNVLRQNFETWHSAAQACGIRIVQLVSQELDCADPYVMEQGRRWITFAASVDVSSLMVPMRVPLLDRIEPELSGVLSTWAALAGEAGTTISIGTPHSVAPDTQAMSRLMNVSHHAAIRLDFDVGRYQQWHPHRSYEIALLRVVGSVGSLRLRDATGTPGEFTSPALGDGGSVDMARIVEIISPLNFQGPVVIEIEAPDCDKSLPATEAMLRDSVRHLADCGWLV